MHTAQVFVEEKERGRSSRDESEGGAEGSHARDRRKRRAAASLSGVSYGQWCSCHARRTTRPKTSWPRPSSRPILSCPRPGSRRRWSGWLRVHQRYVCEHQRRTSAGHGHRGLRRRRHDRAARGDDDGGRRRDLGVAGGRALGSRARAARAGDRDVVRSSRGGRGRLRSNRRRGLPTSVTSVTGRRTCSM